MPSAEITASTLAITFDDAGSQQLPWIVRLRSQTSDGAVTAAAVAVDAMTDDGIVIARG